MTHSQIPAIESLIKNIYHDFKSSTRTGDSLCNLRSLNYQNGNKPDYNDIKIQQLYLLRYLYAYAFECSDMFMYVFSDLYKSDHLTIDSIGCGSAIDCWSIISTIDKLNLNFREIEYRGIDIAEWHYEFGKAPYLKKKLYLGDVGEYYRNKKNLDANIFIFPRSISELSSSSFNIILDAFCNKPIENKVIHLMSSFPLNSDETNDRNRMRTLFNVLTSRGYIKTAHVDSPYNPIRYTQKKYIWNEDPTMHYYKEILGDNFKLNLCELKDKGEICKECPVNWSPMLKLENINYVVTKFERKTI